MPIESQNTLTSPMSSNEEDKIDNLSGNILRKHQYSPEVDDNTIKEALKGETKKYSKDEFKAVISAIEKKIKVIKMFDEKKSPILERISKILKEIYDEIPLTYNEKELKRVKEQNDTNSKILENPEFSKFIKEGVVTLTSDGILVFDRTHNLPVFNYDKLGNNFVSAGGDNLIVFSYNQFKDYLGNVEKEI